MSNLGVGKEIVSHCNKCKLALSHIIVVMKDEKTPHKVQCNTCKSTHNFKDPTAKTIKKITVGRKKKRKVTVANSELWAKALEESPNSPRTYSPKTTFEKGDIVDHPTFGQGIVEKCFDKNKIEVMFKNDIKILVHNI